MAHPGAAQAFGRDQAFLLEVFFLGSQRRFPGSLTLRSIVPGHDRFQSLQGSGRIAGTGLDLVFPELDLGRLVLALRIPDRGTQPTVRHFLIPQKGISIRRNALIGAGKRRAQFAGHPLQHFQREHGILPQAAAVGIFHTDQAERGIGLQRADFQQRVFVLMGPEQGGFVQTLRPLVFLHVIIGLTGLQQGPVGLAGLPGHGKGFRRPFHVGRFLQAVVRSVIDTGHIPVYQRLGLIIHRQGLRPCQGHGGLVIPAVPILPLAQIVPIFGIDGIAQTRPAAAGKDCSQQQQAGYYFSHGCISVCADKDT